MRKYQIALCCAVLTAVFFSGRASAQDLQTQITTACQAGGGTVQLPQGLIQISQPLQLCSNLNLIGKGRGQSELGLCPTTIATSMPSGTLFPIVNMNHIHLSDFCIKNNGMGGPVAIFLGWGQFITLERLYIEGPFSVGLSLAPGTASTIENHFSDIHTTGFGPAGIGCLLNGLGLSNKVLNNNYFNNVNCTGGTGGVGLEIMSNAAVPNINEVIFTGGQFNAAGGIGVQIRAGSVRDLLFFGADIEGSSFGFDMEPGQDGVTCLGCNISANTQNIFIAPISTRTFFTGHFGTDIQRFSLDPFGSLGTGSLCIIPASCDPGNFNAPSGFAFEASGNSVAFLSTSSLQLNRPVQADQFGFSQLPNVQDGSIVYCLDCTTAPTCAGGGTGEFAKRKHGIWACN